MNHAQIPVIVGVGELTQRPGDGISLDPIALMAAALRRAENDAGTPLLTRLDRIEIINEISWPYPDPCRELSQRLGCVDLPMRYHPVGGQTPMLALHDAALAIRGGEAQAIAICGGEAEHSVRRAQREGRALDWPDRIPDFKPIRGGDYQPPLARALELTSPVNVYPLYEAATRAAWGQTLAEAAMESATIWARNAAVARTRTAAWIDRALTPADILDEGGGNRLIAWPYRKLMVANPIVDQGAAVIVVSLALARSLGIPDARMVHILGGAAADEPRDILARSDYASSAAMESVLADATALSPGGFDVVEVYSCFPCVPKMARRTLGLPATAPLSVAGGLTFFGAPLNNYMTHAAVAMVERLRATADTGLLYAQGEYVTKHHALVLSGGPCAAGLREDYRRTDVEAALAAAAPRLVADYRGPARVETATVLFDRDERVRHGVVVLRTPTGARTAARVPAIDEATLRLLMSDAAIGAVGTVRAGEGAGIWTAA